MLAGRMSVSVKLARWRKAQRSTGSPLPRYEVRQERSFQRQVAKREEKTWHKLDDDRQHATASAHIATTSRVSQTTLSDFSKNLEEPSPTENEEEIDDQTRSMDTHEIQCEKEYWSDLRADTGTLFLPDKIAMESHSLTHFLRCQPWSKETKSSGFEESAGELTKNRDSAMMPEMWITNTNPGRRSTMMELASATPLNESRVFW